MNRRNFLKALGFGSGMSAVAACGLDDNRYFTPIEQILPYVVRPEQVTPGTPTFFATTVLSGPDAYPALARHRDGRVINVSANTKAPAPPAVANHAFFELQRHYNPDRIREPQQKGAAITWEQGLQQLSGAIQQARAQGKRVVYLGGYRSGSVVELLQGFTGGDAIFWEPLGREAEARAAQLLFGSPELPRYDIAGAHNVLSFGAEFLGGGWGGAWSQAAYARARNPNVGGFVARYTHISPHRGQSGANADDWLAVAPGSEAQVALAIARLVAQKKGYQGPAAALVASADPGRAAAAAGVDVAALEEVATRFASAPSIALPGGVNGASAAATELAAAVYLLNLVSGSGLFHQGGYPGPIDGLDRLEQLVADMRGGQVGVLLIDDVDPVYALPSELGFAEALQQVALTVGLSSHPNATNALVGLLLPTSDTFEDWGDEEPIRGLHLIRQPAMTPLWNTRSLGDILLATWRTVDPATAPQGSWREYVAARWARELFPARSFWSEVGGIDAHVPAERLQPWLPGAASEDEQGTDGRPARQALGTAPGAAVAAGFAQPAEEAPANPLATSEFQRWWEQTLAAGFALHPLYKAAIEPTVTGRVAFSEPPALSGSGALDLVAYVHPFVLDGRYANQPWAQEIPEPLTGIVWNNFALLHPETAARLGLTDGQSVVLTTDKGSLELGVEIQPLVRPGAVAVAIGQGKTAGGRYAEISGKRLVDLLSLVKDAHGVMVWQQKKVDVKPGGSAARPISTFGHDTDNDRAFAVTVAAEKLAAVGDAPSEHPGELTGIHLPPLDERLRRANVAGFYPIPDHPTYRFGMTIDTNACTGCGACEAACYAENNLPVVGPKKVAQRRQMAWIRVNRYYEDGGIYFVPMLCQQCGHAPCESVCPVLATYHTIDGLNAMVYNRCVGTRYCSNACPYSVRRFNYHTYSWPEPFNLQLNPDVVTRTMGVMEKCSFCVQRIRDVKSAYRDRGFDQTVPRQALEQLTACAEACPSQAIWFGNLNDEASIPHTTRHSARNYYPLAELNTYPAINYLAKANFHVDPTLAHHGPPGEHAPGGTGVEHSPAAHGEEAPAGH